MMPHRITIAVLLAACTACAPQSSLPPPRPIAKQSPPASASSRTTSPDSCAPKDIPVRVALRYAYYETMSGDHVEVMLDIPALGIKETIFWSTRGVYRCTATPFVDGTQMSIACLADVASSHEAAQL